MMVFMPLVFVWIGQFCQNVEVVVIGQLLFCCYFQTVYCLFVSFIWGQNDTIFLVFLIKLIQHLLLLAWEFALLTLMRH